MYKISNAFSCCLTFLRQNLSQGLYSLLYDPPQASNCSIIEMIPTGGGSGLSAGQATDPNRPLTVQLKMLGGSYCVKDVDPSITMIELKRKIVDSTDVSGPYFCLFSAECEDPLRHDMDLGLLAEGRKTLDLFAIPHTLKKDYVLECFKSVYDNNSMNIALLSFFFLLEDEGASHDEAFYESVKKEFISKMYGGSTIAKNIELKSGYLFRNNCEPFEHVIFEKPTSIFNGFFGQSRPPKPKGKYLFVLMLEILGGGSLSEERYSRPVCTLEQRKGFNSTSLFINPDHSDGTIWDYLIVMEENFNNPIFLRISIEKIRNLMIGECDKNQLEKMIIELEDIIVQEGMQQSPLSSKSSDRCLAS